MSHEDLMRYLDGELPEEGRSRFEVVLASSTELQRELAIFRGIQAGLQDLSFAVDPADSAWTRVNRRVTRPVGWTLVVVGAVLWAAYGAWVFVRTPGVPWEKWAIGLLVIGFLVLLGSTVWERYREWHHDPYRHIER